MPHPQFVLTIENILAGLVPIVWCVLAWNAGEPQLSNAVTRKYWESVGGVPERYFTWLKVIHAAITPVWIALNLFFADDLYIILVAMTALRSAAVWILNKIVLKT